MFKSLISAELRKKAKEKISKKKTAPGDGLVQMSITMFMTKEQREDFRLYLKYFGKNQKDVLYALFQENFPKFMNELEEDIIKKDKK